MSDNRIQLIAKLHQMQGGICFIGEEPLDLTKDKLEIDHIIPRAKGGKDVEPLFEYLEDDLSVDEFLDCFPTVRREDAIAVQEHSKAELLVHA